MSPPTWWSELQRSATWPASTRDSVSLLRGTGPHITEPGSLSAPAIGVSHHSTPFYNNNNNNNNNKNNKKNNTNTNSDGDDNSSTFGEDDNDIDNNPDAHFLSPMEYSFNDWDDDSDDDYDDDEVEWNAGIHDFALFDNDRRRAQEAHEELPSQWSDMLSSQTSALQRAVQRSHDPSEPNWHSASPLRDDMLPGLTPDSSPNLRDDMDVDNFLIPSHTVPNYPTVVVTPPSEDGAGKMIPEDDEDLPLSLLIARAEQRQQLRQAQKPQRPGLRHARTMSGKLHSWRRPDWDIYPVGEDAEAEQRAEREDGEEDVGRG